MPVTLAVPVSDFTLADLRREATDTGSSPEQVAAARLAALLPPRPGPRPPKSPEEVQAALAWVAGANALRAEQAAKYGVLPDSTSDIAADRRRDI